MPAITSVNLANAITKLVAVDALPMLVGNLIVGNLARRDFEPTVAGIADDVNVPVLTPGGVSGVPIGLNYAESAFTVPDVTKILAVPDLLKLYMQPAIVELAERIDNDLLNAARVQVSEFGNELTADTLSMLDCDMSSVAIHNKPWFLLVDPPNYHTLRYMPQFSEYQTAADVGLWSFIDGPVGTIHGFYVIRKPRMQGWMVLTKETLGMVIRRLPKPQPGTGAIAEYAELGNFGMRVVLDYRPGTLAQKFTLDILYGVGTLHPDLGRVPSK